MPKLTIINLKFHIMLLYFVYVIAGIGISIIASRSIAKCRNMVEYIQREKGPNRVIIKTELTQKILTIQSYLSFGFLVSLIITAMGFMIIEQHQSGILYYISTGCFSLIPLLFAWQCYRSLQVSQEIDKL